MVAQKSAALRLLLAWGRLTKGLAASAGRIEGADGRGSGGELTRCSPRGAQRRRHGAVQYGGRYGERATQKQSREEEAEG
jgi:hypothetical protein